MRRAVVLLFLVGGCGNSKTNTQGNPDLSMTGTEDLTMAGTDVDLTMGPDMVVAPIQGSPIVMGSCFLEGVTSDDQVIYDDVATGGALTAVPIAGGKSQKIDSSATNLAVIGNSVFTWDGASTVAAGATNGSVGTFNTWSAATGLNPISLTQSIVGVSVASTDQKWIWYSDNANNPGTTTDLYVAKFDGTSAMKIGTSTYDTTKCAPDAKWTGTLFLFHYCPEPGDGGATGSAYATVDPTSGTVTPVFMNAGNSPFSLDSGNTKAFVGDASGAGWVVPVTGGGAPTKIDADVKDGWILPDGNTVVYNNSKGALLRATIGANPAPTTLVATGVTQLLYQEIGQNVLPGLSADGKYLVYATTVDSMTGLSDLFLASTATPGTPVTLNSDTMGAIFGDAFTQDSSHALFYTGTFEITQISGFVGKLNALPVAGGGMPTVYAKTAWVSYAGQGSKVVYNDNTKPQGTTHGRADLYWVDTASTTAPSLIATAAESDFYMSNDRSKVAFCVTAKLAANSALYVLDIK